MKNNFEIRLVGNIDQSSAQKIIEGSRIGDSLVASYTYSSGNGSVIIGIETNQSAADVKRIFENGFKDEDVIVNILK